MKLFSSWRKPPAPPDVAQIPTPPAWAHEQPPRRTEQLEAALGRVTIDFRNHRNVEYRFRFADGKFTPWTRPYANVAVAPPAIDGEGAIEWRTRR
jgi:hypothetical protein